MFSSHDSATSDIYTLSLHDALPICTGPFRRKDRRGTAASERLLVLWACAAHQDRDAGVGPPDRKSTRLNSSHPSTSYAVFCLKKKMLIDRTIATNGP